MQPEHHRGISVGKAPPPDRRFSLVTVVFDGEVQQLRLQARSLAHFATQLGIGEVIVCINDVNEEKVRQKVETVRPIYGALAPLLRVVTGSELLAQPREGRGFRYGLRHAWTSRAVATLRNRGGWRGHDGWQLQQAMKLVVGRSAKFPYILILDAKNFLVAPVAFSDFVADDGRPRTRYTESGPLHERWYPASARLLGAPETPPGVLTNFATPYCISRELLNAVVARIEMRGWPVPAVFCRPRNRATEFMLICAYCEIHCGGIARCFAPDLLRSYTVFGSHPADLAQAILQEALDSDAKMIGIHSHKLASLEEHHRKQVEELMLRHGLFENASDLWSVL